MGYCGGDMASVFVLMWPRPRSVLAFRVSQWQLELEAGHDGGNSAAIRVCRTARPRAVGSGSLEPAAGHGGGSSAAISGRVQGRPMRGDIIGIGLIGIESPELDDGHDVGISAVINACT